MTSKPNKETILHTTIKSAIRTFIISALLPFTLLIFLFGFAISCLSIAFFFFYPTDQTKMDWVIMIVSIILIFSNVMSLYSILKNSLYENFYRIFKELNKKDIKNNCNSKETNS